MNVVQAKADITNILQKHANIAPSRIQTLLPVSSLQGKLYEAHVLATICENLVTKEGLSLSLVNGTKLRLKQKGSPINRTFPHIAVYKNGTLFGELWTDIYFNTLSYSLNGGSGFATYGDYHELDITLVRPGITGYPQHNEIFLAVECKNTTIKKSIIREMLGFRRELSYYHGSLHTTNFSTWPIDQVHANPASVHMLYCSDRNVTRYAPNCSTFGILLQYHKI